MVTWWAPSTNTTDSGLAPIAVRTHRGQQRRARHDAAGIEIEEAVTRLAELAARGGPVVEEAVPVAPVAGCRPAVAPAATLSVGVFDRELDMAWRRMSYSSLAAAGDAGHGPGVTSEPETGEREDEAMPSVPSPDRG